MTSTVFDSQQWGWRRAYEETDDYVVENVVYVFDTTGSEEDVAVVVPTEFLTYFSQTHPNADVSDIQLYCDNMEGDWKFGYLFEDESNVDLWTYKNLPEWLNPKIKSVPG